MLPASKNAVPSLARAGLLSPLMPVSVCPVTVLPFLTRDGKAFPSTARPSSQIVPETALCEQGTPPPDRGVSTPFPFPPDTPRDEELET